MRYYGTITRWNSKRGFGAATIEDTGQEIFLALCRLHHPYPPSGRRATHFLQHHRRPTRPQRSRKRLFRPRLRRLLRCPRPSPRKTPRRQTGHHRPDRRYLRLQHFRRLVVRPPLFRQHTGRASRQKTRNYGSRSSRQNRSRTQSMARCRQWQQPTIGAASTSQR